MQQRARRSAQPLDRIMVIVYTVRFRDLWRFSAIHQLRSPVFQAFTVGICALLAWFSVRGSSCTEKGICIAVGLILFILAYVSLVALQFAFNAAFLYARNNRNVLTEHRVEIRDDGLYEETAFSRSLFLWPGIHRVVKAAGFTAVYVTAHSALLIPIKAFESTAQREQFISTVRGKLRAV